MIPLLSWGFLVPSFNDGCRHDGCLQINSVFRRHIIIFSLASVHQKNPSGAPDNPFVVDDSPGLDKNYCQIEINILKHRSPHIATRSVLWPYQCAPRRRRRRRIGGRGGQHERRRRRGEEECIRRVRRKRWHIVLAYREVLALSPSFPYAYADLVCWGTFRLQYSTT